MSPAGPVLESPLQTHLLGQHIGYFSRYCDEIHDRDNLVEERFSSGSQHAVTVKIGRGSTASQARSHWSHYIHS